MQQLEVKSNISYFIAGTFIQLKEKLNFRVNLTKLSNFCSLKFQKFDAVLAKWNFYKSFYFLTFREKKNKS